jgi:hypothetical protein
MTSLRLQLLRMEGLPKTMVIGGKSLSLAIRLQSMRTRNSLSERSQGLKTERMMMVGLGSVDPAEVNYEGITPKDMRRMMEN